MNSLQSPFSDGHTLYTRPLTPPANSHSNLSMSTGSLIVVPPSKESGEAANVQQLCNSTRGQHCPQPQSVQKFPEEGTHGTSFAENQGPANVSLICESSYAGSTAAGGNLSEPSDVLPSASTIVMCSDQDHLLLKIESKSQIECSDVYRLVVSAANGESLSTGTKAMRENELAANAATEIQLLKDTIRRLEEENDVLKAALWSRKTGRVTSKVCAAPPELSNGNLVCLPLTATEGSRQKQDGDINTEEENCKPKAKRCKAPGAPPRIRPPHEKLPVAHPAQSKRGEKSANRTSCSSHKQWGWCLSGEPVSSLRTCCTDHLLLEGTCVSGDTTSSRSGEGSPSTCPVQEVAKGLVEVPWLLNLEETVQATLTGPQHNLPEDLRKPSSSGFSRGALKSLVDEIGFSGNFLCCISSQCMSDSLR